MKVLRSVEAIRHDLETAVAFRDRARRGATDDVLVHMLDDRNTEEIAGLLDELATATAADLEVAIEGDVVSNSSISVPYFQRLLEQLQSVYRSVRRSLLADGDRLGYTDASLLLSGTAPGSFRAFFRAPGQMELVDDAPADVALNEMLTLLSAPSTGQLDVIVGPWRDRAEERTLRAFIRLASTLAGGRSTTTLRVRTAHGVERRATITSDDARRLTQTLVGGPGVEVLVVQGRMEMAQENPIRVRIHAPDDSYTAEASAEMTDLIRDLIFSDVTATLSIEMRTSPTTGAPTQRATVLALAAAS